MPGATLAIHAVGPARGTPLLIVHGGPGESHHALRPWLDALGDDHRRVVYYDQRGSGGSALAGGAKAAGCLEHVADVERLREHLGVARIDVLGFSWGALLTVAYALRNPGRVARAVLVSPPDLRGTDTDIAVRLEAAHARDAVQAVLQAAEQRAAGGGEEARRAARFARRVAPVLSDPSLVTRLTPVERDEAAAEAAARSMRDVDPGAELERLRSVPTLVVTGADDPISAAVAPGLAEALGARALVLAACGHAPFAEAPEAFLRGVRTFLGPSASPRA